MESSRKADQTSAVRRSQRLLLTIRVLVSGKQVSGLPFSEDALTQVVNAHGALILMKQLVSTGDRLQKKHKDRRRGRLCCCRHRRAARTQVRCRRGV